MNTSPDSPIGKKDETKKDGNIQAKFAQWLSPFQITFVIFWVVCNYDFLLILIGKKAILHDLYSHFGYGCGEKSINLLGYCAKKSSDAYSWYFLIWKIAIPFVLTVGYIKYYYPTFVAPLNLEYENTGKDVLRWIVNDEVDKKIKEIRDIDRKVTEEEMRVFAEINKHLDMDIERNEMDKQRQHLKTLDK